MYFPQVTPHGQQWPSAGVPPLPALPGHPVDVLPAKRGDYIYLYTNENIIFTRTVQCFVKQNISEANYILGGFIS